MHQQSVMRLQLTGSTFVAFFGGFLHVLYKKFMPYANCYVFIFFVKNVTKLQVEKSSSLFSCDTPWLLDCRIWVRCVVLSMCFFFFVPSLHVSFCPVVRR